MDAGYQRDAVIGEIHRAAARDPDLYFVSPDFGAPALDAFRAELPRQFLHAGVSEQNLIDLAAGLALAGKRVFVYAMAPFLSLRSLEQIKCSLAAMELPVTLLSVGGGLGYGESGPTHHATEELACMRALGGIEVHTPSDCATARAMAIDALARPAFRVLRLERAPVPALYKDTASAMASGYGVFGDGPLCVLACGFMTHRALHVKEALRKQGRSCTVVDLLRLKPLGESLADLLARHEQLFSLEEQRLAGGFGSALLEFLSDRAIARPLTRLGLPDLVLGDNGGREDLLERYGLGVEAIVLRMLAAKAPGR
jgi:transketolase